jgi:ribosomal protein S18 acetylase RimI-like enzyme
MPVDTGANMPLPASYHLRVYLPEDLPRLQEITIATFEPVSIDRNIERILGTFGPIDWRDRKAAAITVDCQMQPDGVFVAENAAGEVVGFVSTRLNVASKAGWIPNMAVDPAHQGRGLGTALLQHAMEYLRTNGMEIVKIETLEQNPVGQKLYPRLGFVEVARQIHYAKRLTNPSSDSGGEKHPEKP